MKKLAAFAVSACMLTAISAQDVLPSLELYDIDGNKIDISSYTTDGKITIFSFWATWCIPCKEELNNIADLYAEWQELYNIEIVAVSIDDSKTKANVKSYAEGQGWEYTVLLDVNKDLHRLLGGQSVPFMVITDKNGVIIEKLTGYIEGDEYTLEETIKTLAQ